MANCFMTMLRSQLPDLTREQPEFTCEISDIVCIGLVPGFGTTSKLLPLPSSQVRSIWCGLPTRAVATACTGSSRTLGHGNRRLGWQRVHGRQKPIAKLRRYSLQLIA